MKALIGIARAAALAAGIGMAAGQIRAEGAAPAAGVQRDFDWSGPARDFDWADGSQDPRIGLAEAAMDVQDWAGAVQILAQVIAASPNDAEAYTYLGRSHRRLGEFEQALADLERALYLSAADRTALAELGALYLDMNDLRGAEAQLNRLARVCGADCLQYRDLNEMVLRFKAVRPRG